MSAPANSPPRMVACPSCRKSIAWSEANPYRPFCSARCKGLDFGAWASEQYRVAAAEEPDPGQDQPG